ncbi:uncharacterized protein LOC117964404 [Acipenser ruthenus]|uniref:uncharacterized protein LOC117964404 n=1 Tax=Acipenser ruthenus TaxID=7906 RepID=UPI0027408EA7|nr:uncharacterized protein LOC117964404 [Acipenser ruthenus]
MLRSRGVRLPVQLQQASTVGASVNILGCNILGNPGASTNRSTRTRKQVNAAATRPLHNSAKPAFPGINARQGGWEATNAKSIRSPLPWTVLPNTEGAGKAMLFKTDPTSEDYKSKYANWINPLPWEESLSAAGNVFNETAAGLPSRQFHGNKAKGLPILWALSPAGAAGCNRFGGADLSPALSSKNRRLYLFTPVAGRLQMRACFCTSSASQQEIKTTADQGSRSIKAESSDSRVGAAEQEREENRKPSKSQQLKKVFKEYGAVGVSFHIGISLMSLGIVYLAISSGIDMTALLFKVGFSEAMVQSKIAAGTSTFVLAYAVHKLFAPVRISITLVSVPFIVRYFRKVGLFKPPVSSP